MNIFSFSYAHKTKNNITNKIIIINSLLYKKINEKSSFSIAFFYCVHLYCVHLYHALQGTHTKSGYTGLKMNFPRQSPAARHFHQKSVAPQVRCENKYYIIMTRLLHTNLFILIIL